MESLTSSLKEVFNFSTNQVVPLLVTVVLAFVIGLFVYLIYRLTFSGVIYSKTFNMSLVMLTMVSTMVILIMSNNVKLSLGMVGALSIVRFRTAIKDSRDTAYIFWTVIVGICCGVGDYIVASVGSVVVFVIMLVLGRIRNDERILLIIRGQRSSESEIESVVFTYFNRGAVLRVKNTTESNIEFIYEIKKKVFNKTSSKEKTITESLYAVGGIEYVNIVTQNDEISG
jgi:ABC-type multidrug transport system fused ATPase/permease subunit